MSTASTSSRSTACCAVAGRADGARARRTVMATVKTRRSTWTPRDRCARHWSHGKSPRENSRFRGHDSLGLSTGQDETYAACVQKSRCSDTVLANPDGNSEALSQPRGSPEAEPSRKPRCQGRSQEDRPREVGGRVRVLRSGRASEPAAVCTASLQVRRAYRRTVPVSPGRRTNHRRCLWTGAVSKFSPDRAA